jgi:hyperosmotically inducible protein
MRLSGVRFCTLALAAAVIADPALAQSQHSSADRIDTLRPGATAENKISKEVRHELVMLPYYGVFDNLSYRVDGSTVTLRGEVTQPTLKSDAGNVVKKIEGVESVDNQIRVLPLSPNDDRIRLAEYRTIYSGSGLDRYALQAVPPIHIIVENGKVTLVGMVASQGDKTLANIRANTVSGAFSVVNELQVENR